MEEAVKTILAIDDDPEILKCYKIALENRKFKIEITSDSSAFFQYLKANPVDMVILDVRMPQKNGFDVFKELRAHKNLPVLFVTAYSGSFSLESEPMRAMWEEDFSDGTTDILYKPFTLNDLYEKVEGLIGSSGDGDA